MPDETTIRLLSLFFFYIGKGENCPKEERWRSQIDSARLVLDRSSTLLLTSSKAFQRYIVMGIIKISTVSVPKFWAIRGTY